MQDESENWKQPTIEHQKISKYGYIVEYPENLTIGRNSDIGVFTYINAHFEIEIQEDVEIGPHCAILSHSSIDNRKGKIIIKKGAKIGGYSTIMPNVTIGKNSLVYAYSYIDKNIEDNQVVKRN
tara:strand:+ start:3244 stop:3615 length:372 start_codon:yes stop_codon:yes gene_type:complete